MRKFLISFLIVLPAISFATELPVPSYQSAIDSNDHNQYRVKITSEHSCGYGVYIGTEYEGVPITEGVKILYKSYLHYYFGVNGEYGNTCTYTYTDKQLDPQCEDITPPDEYKNLHYSGQSFSELTNCDDALNQYGADYNDFEDYPNSPKCFDAKELSGNDNACQRYFLYVPCDTPPSEYDGLDLFYPFPDQQSCDDYKVNNNFITATNCVQQRRYCPYFFYGTRGDTDPCKDIPTPNSYMGYPLAGTYQNYSSCMSAKTFYNDGNGFCMQLTDDCPLFYGYFNVNGSDNDLTDNDGDGIPDGPNPPSGDATHDNGNNDNNDSGDNGGSGSGDGNNTNGDNGGDATHDNGDSGEGGGSGQIDFTPVLKKLQIISDKNHKDLSNINSKLSNLDQKAKNISDNTAKTVDKLDELIDLMHDQNDLLEGDNNGSGNQGLNVDMSGVEDRLDETNDHLDHIEQNISSIGSVFSRFMDLVSNPQEKIGDLIDSSIDEATDKYLGKQVIDTPNCGVVPTISFEFYGHTITLLSEDIVNQWPLEIFRKMIIFFFALAGLIHVIKDV